MYYKACLFIVSVFFLFVIQAVSSNAMSLVDRVEQLESTVGNQQGTIDDLESTVEDQQDMIEDLLAAAVNDAVRRIETETSEKMSGVTAGMNLPAGMKLPF